MEGSKDTYDSKIWQQSCIWWQGIRICSFIKFVLNIYQPTCIVKAKILHQLLLIITNFVKNLGIEIWMSNKFHCYISLSSIFASF